MLDFENLRSYRENNRIEAKEALGGLPESIWETYSAFANADGGVILLGVEELPDKTLHALDLLDPEWLLEDFRAVLNDPTRVSVNILTEGNMLIPTVDGGQIIAITVPPAPAAVKPVYVVQEEHWTAFYRSGEADCRCTEEQLQAMHRQRARVLAEQLSGDLRRELADYLAAHHRQETDFARAPKASCMVMEDCAPMAAQPKLKKAAPRGLRELLQRTDAGFSETLLKLIDKTGKKDSEIYTRANLSRQHFSKIRNNPGYRPTKATALALAVALELDLEQTRDLIGRAGYALTKSSKFDLIVMYFIEKKHFDLNDINAALYEFDQSLLGA